MMEKPASLPPRPRAAWERVPEGRVRASSCQSPNRLASHAAKGRPSGEGRNPDQRSSTAARINDMRSPPTHRHARTRSAHPFPTTKEDLPAEPGHDE